MCQSEKRIGIAKKSRFRFITTCKHNSVYAQWDNITLSWRMEDFLRFGEMVRERVENHDIPEPSVMLRINGTAIGWMTADFIEFASMVLEAIASLDRGLAYIEKQRLINRPLPHLDNKFSLN